MPALRPDDYSVTVEKNGFNTQTRAGLELVVDQELPVPVTLAVGTSTQEITVTEEAPQVNTTTSSLGGLVNEDKTGRSLKNGRNFVDLASLECGRDEHQWQLDFQSRLPVGARRFSQQQRSARSVRTNFTLDGATMTNVRGVTAGAVGHHAGGGWHSGIQSHHERVQRGVRAEHGQPGSDCKQGRDQPVARGDTFEYLRNASLDTPETFFDQSHITTGNRLPGFQRNQFGGSFGGPIKKEKTFFYAVYEGLRQKGRVKHLVTLCSGHATCLNPANLVPSGTPGTDNFITDAAAKACNSGLVGIGGTGTVSPVNTLMLPFLYLYPAPNIPGPPDHVLLWPPKIQPTWITGKYGWTTNLSSKDSIFGRYTTRAGRTPEADETKSFPGYAVPIDGRDRWIPRCLKITSLPPILY